MTNNDRLPLSIITDGKALAQAMMNTDQPPIFNVDTITVLSRLLPALAFIAFCQAADLCPTHHTGIDVCEDDDEPACRRYRADLRRA